jgi:hypothetical protein
VKDKPKLRRCCWASASSAPPCSTATA